MAKTRATSLLDKKKISYELRDYDADSENLGAEEASEKLGIDISQVFKTLMLETDKSGIALACLPGTHELDLKKAAKSSGSKKAVMTQVSDLKKLTGYIRGGVSPLGVKKNYPVFLDRSCLQFDFISISAGMRGLQILINPEDLIKLSRAQVCDLRKDTQV